MKSSTKFWLAIFTFLPIVLIIVFFGFFFAIFLENIIALENNHGDFPLELMQSVFWFIIFIILIALISLGVRIYYIVDTNGRAENDTTKKIMWSLILVFLGTIGSVVYYIVEIAPLKSTK